MKLYDFPWKKKSTLKYKYWWGKTNSDQDWGTVILIMLIFGVSLSYGLAKGFAIVLHLDK